MSLNNKFQKLFQNCPVCKSKLGCDDNRVFCNNCDFDWYNNPAPSVSIALLKDKKILLAKRKIEPQKGLWDVPGGFIESGESAEEATIREMEEETGLKVKIKKYLGSISDIYNDNPTLPLIFAVEQLDLNQKPIAQDDVEELRWFSLDEIPEKLAFKNVKETIEKVKKYLI